MYGMVTINYYGQVQLFPMPVAEKLVNSLTIEPKIVQTLLIYIIVTLNNTDL